MKIKYLIVLLIISLFLVGGCAKEISVTDKFRFSQVDWGAKDINRDYLRDIFIRLECDGFTYDSVFLGYLSIDGIKQGQIYCPQVNVPKQMLPENSQVFISNEGIYNFLLPSFPSSRTTRIEICITDLWQFTKPVGRSQKYIINPACKEYVLPAYEGKEYGERCTDKSYRDNEFYKSFGLDISTRIDDECNFPDKCSSRGICE